MESANGGKPYVGVLALQGAFEEHQASLEAVGCVTKQVRTPADLEGLDGLVLPGGESTAMGLIGTTSKTNGGPNMWTALKEFRETKPTWGTCAGMILLAERCVGASAVIQDGQALVGGMDLLVCRNYFGSQVSSFEMPIPPPPPSNGNNNTDQDDVSSFPGVFIRAPAILSVPDNSDIQILAKVMATPCRQAAVVLEELEHKLAKGEAVVVMGVVDALDRTTEEGTKQQHIDYKKVTGTMTTTTTTIDSSSITLPGAANGTTAREVICAVQRDNILCTAFHPELTDDHRWHEYFVNTMVMKYKQQQQQQQ